MLVSWEVPDHYARTQREGTMDGNNKHKRCYRTWIRVRRGFVQTTKEEWMGEEVSRYLLRNFGDAVADTLGVGESSECLRAGLDGGPSVLESVADIVELGVGVSDAVLRRVEDTELRGNRR